MILGAFPALLGLWIAESDGFALPRGKVLAGATAGMLAVASIAAFSRTRMWPRLAVTLLVLCAASTASVFLWIIPQRAQDKAVQLFQIRAAARQFFIDHPQRIFVPFEELVGPDRYLKHLWRDEDRREFPLRADLRELGVTLPPGHRAVLLCDAEGNYQAFVRHLRDGRFCRIGTLSNGADLELYRKWLAERPRNGVDVRVLRDGRKFEITYRDGVPHGPFRAFYADGRPWGEATYISGRPAGRHVVFDRTGDVIHEANFDRPAGAAQSR